MIVLYRNTGLSLLVLLIFVSSTIAQKKKGFKPEQKCYAELSVKKGGEWKDRKYEGGVFENVQRLKVPASHTDHSFYIRYEGPGWESNKVGYRLYLDWRNAIDIFGKLTDTLVLPYVGQDGFDSYHAMCPWGMDILKVAKGLGIGSIGKYTGTEVLHFKEVDSTFAYVQNTKKKSAVIVDYYGWKTGNDKTDLHSELSIAPDQRYTLHTIKSLKEIDGICTGIVNLGLKPFTKTSKSGKWAYLATYGQQTLVPDKLGMAIFYKPHDAEKLTDWEFDHLIIFKPTAKEISFYFLAAWEKELNGIKSMEEFVNYLDGLLNQLDKKGKI
ncbi:MAG: DUF4861 family protein [Bacteroidales bacterium]